MKRFLCMAVAFLLVLSIASCEIGININTNSSGKEEVTTAGESISDEISKEPTENTDEENEDDDLKGSDDNVNDDNTNDNTNDDNIDNTPTVDNIDNGVLKEVSPENMNVPENMKFLD